MLRGGGDLSGINRRCSLGNEAPPASLHRDWNILLFLLKTSAARWNHEGRVNKRLWQDDTVFLAWPSAPNVSAHGFSFSANSWPSSEARVPNRFALVMSCSAENSLVVGLKQDYCGSVHYQLVVSDPWLQSLTEFNSMLWDMCVCGSNVFNVK